VPATVTVADTTDTTSFVALFESATGDLGPKTDAGVTYNAGTGMLTATGFTGPLTGNASGTAATVTGGTQASITSAANLATVGTIGTGVWQGTALASGYIANDAIDSQHYAAGSIDNEHLADDAVDSDEIAAGAIDLAHMSANSIDSTQYVDGSIDLAHMSADSIDSTQYVDGSIDLAHMSSQSVDEDNLYISNSGSNGEFLSKQSGNSGGLTWASAGGTITALNNATANELVTIGSTTTELDAEAYLTFDGLTLNIGTGSSVDGHLNVHHHAAGGIVDFTNQYTQARMEIYGDDTQMQLRSYIGLELSAGHGNQSHDFITFMTNNGASQRMRIYEAGDIKVTKSVRVTQAALTSSSSAIAWDVKDKQNCYHVTTENTTFSAPSNAVEGAVICVEIAQGGTARTIAWNTIFEFAASTAPTITATASKTDILTFRYNGSVWQEIGRVQNMAQT